MGTIQGSNNAKPKEEKKMNISRNIFKTEAEARFMAGRMVAAGCDLVEVARLAVSRSGFWFVDSMPSVRMADFDPINARMVEVATGLVLSGWKMTDIDTPMTMARSGEFGRRFEKDGQGVFLNFHSVGGFKTAC